MLPLKGTLIYTSETHAHGVKVINIKTLLPKLTFTHYLRMVVATLSDCICPVFRDLHLNGALNACADGPPDYNIDLRGVLTLCPHWCRSLKRNEHKMSLFSYPSVLTFVLGAQKNRLNETVLLSTHNICFG